MGGYDIIDWLSDMGHLIVYAILLFGALSLIADLFGSRR